MLEFCLPGGGLKGVALSGAMFALRTRGVVPDVVAGISSGAQAAYAALSENPAVDAVGWFKQAKALMKSKPLARFVPPYDTTGAAVLAIATRFGSDPSYLRTLGVRHFYVGYTELWRLRLVVEDILSLSSRSDAYLRLLKSSTIPFVTHFAPHCAGAVDGGFRRMVFSSPCPSTKERWLLTYGAQRVMSALVRVARFDRIVCISSGITNPFYATDRQIDEAYALGFEQGMRISL
jgi:predicted acylesterase/phospholipase RssA